MDSNHPWRETRLPALLAGEEKPNVDDVAPFFCRRYWLPSRECSDWWSFSG